VEAGVEEEEIIDPINSLMESMSKLKPGEQQWIQISASPIYFGDKKSKEFIKKSEQERDTLAKRDVGKPKLEPLWKEILGLILEGPKETEEKALEMFPAEMRLTLGERELVEAVEKKSAKPLFSCYIRNIYVARREVWYTPNRRLLLSYFNNFTSSDLNSLWVWSKTLTRVKLSPIPFVNALAARRAYIKKRRMLRVYRDRLNYYNPWIKGDEGHEIKLNVEELASLFHFPSSIVAPTPGITRTDAKETVAPGNLPI
jgi:hypothetical protein